MGGAAADALGFVAAARSDANAVRLHVCLHVLDDAPVRARVTTGRGCERKNWQAGAGYVGGDRYFGEDYRLFAQLHARGCFFVLRLRTDAVITVEQELALSEEDRAAGVIRSAWAHLGSKARYRSMRVRVLWVQTPQEVLVLVNNQPAEELSAALAAELYRRRWQVELFFRWIKSSSAAGSGWRRASAGWPRRCTWR